MSNVRGQEAQSLERSDKLDTSAAQPNNSVAAPAQTLEYQTPAAWLPLSRRAGTMLAIGAALLLPIVLSLTIILVLILANMVKSLVDGDPIGQLVALGFGFLIITIPLLTTVRAGYRLIVAARKLFAGKGFPLAPLVGNIRVTTGLAFFLAALCLIGFTTEWIGLCLVGTVSCIFLGAGLIVTTRLLNQLGAKQKICAGDEV